MSVSYDFSMHLKRPRCLSTGQHQDVDNQHYNFVRTSTVLRQRAENVASLILFCQALFHLVQ